MKYNKRYIQDTLLNLSGIEGQYHTPQYFVPNNKNSNIHDKMSMIKYFAKWSFTMINYAPICHIQKVGQNINKLWFRQFCQSWRQCPRSFLETLSWYQKQYSRIQQINIKCLCQKLSIYNHFVMYTHQSSVHLSCRLTYTDNNCHLLWQKFFSNHAGKLPDIWHRASVWRSVLCKTV